MITKKRIIKSHKALVEHLKKKLAQQREKPTIIIIENDDTPSQVVFENVVSNKNQPTSQNTQIIEFVDVNSTPSVSSSVLNSEKKIKPEHGKINNLHLGEKNQGSKEQYAEMDLQNVIDHFNGDKSFKKQELVCEICNLKFTYKSEFNLHKNKHKKSKCQICNAVIRTDNFRKHLMLHNAAPMNCKICGTTCKNIESLRGHIYYQHKMQPDTYVCEECGKKFRTKYKFSLHKKKEHTGLRAFKCETCGKGFFTKGNLMTHDRMTHKKLRPHICEFCGTGFSSPYALKTHKRQHTNEKPYVCEFCDEGFRQKVSLRSHLKSKHGYEESKEAVCQQCGKGFASTYALNIHERLHVNTEKCTLCSDSFVEKEYLINHMKQVHSNEVADNVEIEEEIVEATAVKLEQID